MSTRNGARFLRALCSSPSARTRVRHIPSAQSYRARRCARGHQLRCAECPPADRSPQHQGVHPKSCGVHAPCRPAHPFGPPESADTASPNPTRNALGKALSQTPAPAVLQKAVPQPAESLSVAAHRVCSFNLSLENRPRIVAVHARVSNGIAIAGRLSLESAWERDRGRKCNGRLHSRVLGTSRCNHRVRFRPQQFLRWLILVRELLSLKTNWRCHRIELTWGVHLVPTLQANCAVQLCQSAKQFVVTRSSKIMWNTCQFR